VTSRVKQHTRAASLRPIEDAEIPYVEAVGECVKHARLSQVITQAELGKAAQVSTSTIQRIEAGTRRTRRSTLDRISLAVGDPALTDELVGLAGAALAPESPYAERIARRRSRRIEKKRRRRAHAEREERRAREASIMADLRQLQRLAERDLKLSRQILGRSSTP
jgi:transcriptional regulator with XRE-family HTH domain